MKPFRILPVLLSLLLLGGCTFPSGDDLLGRTQAIDQLSIPAVRA